MGDLSATQTHNCCCLGVLGLVWKSSLSVKSNPSYVRLWSFTGSYQTGCSHCAPCIPVHPLSQFEQLEVRFLLLRIKSQRYSYRTSREYGCRRVKTSVPTLRRPTPSSHWSVTWLIDIKYRSPLSGNRIQVWGTKIRDFLPISDNYLEHKFRTWHNVHT